MSATIPKASEYILPLKPPEAPIAKGNKKVAARGPDATAPESKAIDVNKGGTIKVKISAIRYPGITKYSIDIPVMTLIMDKATDTPTPNERPRPMAFAEMDPSVTSSTCSLSTKTAGSAATTK